VLKCFIASAFGREDVDCVYDDAVLPVLKRLSMTPLRVDRVEHNDDIDEKITELITTSDLAIVDLTYARPSAYYEAGYAAGLGKPVVYIVRKDHLRARDSDPEGLLRVHFDLQMKNIIAWSKANTQFDERLERRLRHVSAPLAKQLEKQQAVLAERAKFARLAQHDQLDTLGEKTRAILVNRGFKLRKAEGRYIPFPSRFTVYRETDAVRHDIGVDCAASVTKKGLERYAGYSAMGLRASRWKKNSRFDLILVTLRPVPASRRQQALPDFQTLDDGTMYRRDDAGPSYEFVEETLIHFVDQVGSVAELNAKLQSLLSSHALEPHV
jgi:hypothetical protein